MFVKSDPEHVMDGFRFDSRIIFGLVAEKELHVILIWRTNWIY